MLEFPHDLYEGGIGSILPLPKDVCQGDISVGKCLRVPAKDFGTTRHNVNNLQCNAKINFSSFVSALETKAPKASAEVIHISRHVYFNQQGIITILTTAGYNLCHSNTTVVF